MITIIENQKSDGKYLESDRFQIIQEHLFLEYSQMDIYNFKYGNIKDSKTMLMVEIRDKENDKEKTYIPFELDIEEVKQMLDFLNNAYLKMQNSTL